MARRNLSLLVLSWLLNCCCGASDMHSHMTLEELQSTFHVDHHSLVPEYETVTIHHIRKRSVDSGNPNHPNSLDGGDGKPSSGSKGPEKGKLSSQKAAAEDTAHLRLTAFGKPLNLKLVKTEGLFKKGGLRIWSVEPNATSQHGVEYVEIAQPHDEDLGDTYQDEENLAAVVLRKDAQNGRLLVEGSIGSDMIIRPIPTRLLEAAATTEATTTSTAANGTETTEDTRGNDDEMFLDADGELGAEVAIDTGLPIKRRPKDDDDAVVSRTSKHIVFKRRQQDEDSMSDYALMEPDHLAKRYKRGLKDRAKRDAPYTIYPEILVIVDYDGYRMHGGDNQQIKRYFVSFWNGVDLRYKLLKGPKIRISIAGIIISRGRDATPYLEKNRVGTDAIDSAAALTDMGKYLFRERRLPVYDIAVAITKLDMCRRSYPNDACNRGTAGFAYVGGACVVNKRLEKVNSVAIIEDTGGFSGIIVAAHEVGHLLGAVHDGSPPPSYLGGPGAEKCQWADGYIMSDLRHTERGFRWSPCSISSFHHFLNGDTATCLYNAPHEDTSLPRVLPGKLLTLDAQCRRDRGTSACFKDDRVCAQLFCFDSSSGYCVAYRPAAEGSPCGDGQYCLNGKCVAEHENIIPDYSQNTPSYVRGNGNIQGRPLFYDEEDQVVYQNNPGQPPQTYNEYTTPPQPPYNYYQYQSEDPNQYNTPSTQGPLLNLFSSTYRPFSFSISTTRSPYNFENFGLQSTAETVKVTYASSTEPTQTTKNPYIGNYYQLIKTTTKNPYDFANFGRKYNENVNNNYLKRSYNAASYFSDSSNVRNSDTNNSTAG